MLHKFISCFTLLLLFSLIQVKAQITIAFQGGEGTAADNWNFTPIYDAGGPLSPGIVNSIAKTGSYSIRAGGGNNVGCSGGSNCIAGGGATGCPSHGKIILFDEINTSCLTDVQISCSYSSHPYCSGNGYDSGERIYFEVQLNGSAVWTTVGIAGGFGDYSWNYNTNPAGSPSSGYTLPNPFVYNLPANTSSVVFRVRTNSNRSDEVFYIDDVSISTLTTAYNFPGTDGLWNGEVNTDWHNACNWDNRAVPQASTDVVIQNSALNICEVMTGNIANCNNLLIDKQKLAVEYNTSLLNVFGDLQISLNGYLDMSLAGVQGGSLNLHGDWINNGNESFFEEEKSLVRFVGTSDQFITVDFDTKESFYKLQISKSSGLVLLNDDIYIDINNTGGAVPMLFLSNGLLDLNSNELKIFNENYQAINRLTGGIISERTNNSSIVTRVINSSTGNYLFPFSNISGAYIPFTFSPQSGNSGEVSVSTYSTPANNLPWPTTPVSVNNLISGIGLLPDNRDATVDRFWNINSTGNPTADLTFTYHSSELPVVPYNNASTLKAQRYDSATDLWQLYLSGQTAGAYFVNTPGVNSFGTWTITNEISPLPIELLQFSASLNQQKYTDINWITSTEINNDYFTVERSEDGINFYSIGKVIGSGSTNEINYYHYIDYEPLLNKSYYRLKQTDYDGTSSYSNIVSVILTPSPNSEILIFPNPCSSYFYLKNIDSLTDKSFEILDIRGKKISRSGYSVNETNSGASEVKINNIASGVYFVVFSSGKRTRLVIH